MPLMEREAQLASLEEYAGEAQRGNSRLVLIAGEAGVAPTGFAATVGLGQMADVLVERAGFLASLEGLLGEALEGNGRLVLLGGEAGVGKTTLAAALAGTAAGPAVRRGSCDNITTAEALGPILDALPELAVAADQEAGLSRLRLFQKVRDVLSESPMLLLLEDVHWADEATLDILRFLGRRLAGSRLMILATFRPEEVGRDHSLTMVMGDLAGLPGVVRMQLPALSAAGVRQLLDAVGSDLDPDTIFSLTGGKPVLCNRGARIGLRDRTGHRTRCCACTRGPDVAGRAGDRGRGFGARSARRGGFPRGGVGAALGCGRRVPGRGRARS